MKAVRWFLGRIILLLDFIFSPRGIKRDPAKQIALDLTTQQFSLYQFEACPFCVKVRREIKRQSLKVEIRNAKTPEYGQELNEQGGKLKVPCLRIVAADNQIKWLYESNDIIAYLQQQAA